MDLKPNEIIKIHDKYFEKLIDYKTIQEKVQELADQIYKNEKNEFIFIAVMNGAIHFASDLSRALQKNVSLFTIHAKSYQGLVSTNTIEISGLQNIDLENKHVLLVEDIIDTGQTLTQLIQLLKNKNVSSIKIVSLFFKPQSLKTKLSPDYVGFEIGPEFIIGYGLDYNELGRNLRDIYKTVG